jgi:hypothetical protein
LYDDPKRLANYFNEFNFVRDKLYPKKSSPTSTNPLNNKIVYNHKISEDIRTYPSNNNLTNTATNASTNTNNNHNYARIEKSANKRDLRAAKTQSLNCDNLREYDQAVLHAFYDIYLILSFFTLIKRNMFTNPYNIKEAESMDPRYNTSYMTNRGSKQDSLYNQGPTSVRIGKIFNLLLILEIQDWNKIML